MADDQKVLETVDYSPNGENRCRDFDEDCFGLDHLSCWLYDPAQGLCPFLAPKSKDGRDA